MELDWDSLLGPAPDELAETLWLLSERKKRTAGKDYYKPLDPRRRRLVRAAYRQLLPSWARVAGDCAALCTKARTTVCQGYRRIVIGDYGAFIEFTGSQACLANLTRGSGGNKYNWLRVLDASNTKIYEQLGTVPYADYRVGLYYVDPAAVELG